MSNTQPASTSRQQVLSDAFAHCRQTATSCKDLTSWFLAHPETIPGLAPQYHDCVEVTMTCEQIHIEADRIQVGYLLNFFIENPPPDTARLFERVTGIDLGERAATGRFFDMDYYVVLDVTHWRCAFADALAILDDDEWSLPHVSTVLATAFTCHFQHASSDAFLAMKAAGLVPREDDAIVPWLKTVEQLETPVVMPDDLA